MCRRWWGWSDLKRMKRLTRQEAVSWWLMGNNYLMAASQLVWQDQDVVRENIALYHWVSGLRANEEFWRCYGTGSVLLLSSLATECALKAISIQATRDGSCLRTHDLRILWDDVDEYKEKVRRELCLVRERLTETRFGTITLVSVDEIIEAHRDTFEKGRYYNEKDRHLDLMHNIDLWQLGLATTITAREFLHK